MKKLVTLATLTLSTAAVAMGGGPAAPMPTINSAANSTTMQPIAIPSQQRMNGMASMRECQPVSEEAVAGLFDRWNASLKTLDPARVAANYAPNGVLLPTVSNRPRITNAGIQDYFAHWLEKGPEGEIVFRHISLGCNMANDAGVYKFTYDNGQQVVARYTYSYVYDEPSGKWLIASHHSSAMPQDIETEAVEEF